MTTQPLQVGTSADKTPAGAWRVKPTPIWLRMWRSRISYIMLLPFLVPFVVFVIIPLFQSALVSFYDYSAVKTDVAEFVGTENYVNLLSLEIKEQPALLEEGSRVFQCGRKKLPEAEVAAYEAEEGKTCEPAFARARDILTEGFSEWKSLSLFGTQVMIGARDARFWTSIINTMTFAFWTVIGKLILGLMIALILQKQSKLNYFLRMVFFLPSVTASIAVTVVWGWIFKGQSYGLINYLLLQTGMVTEPISFLNDANWTMPILIFMTIWGGIGYNMILFLAGLQNINPELYEVAAIDGADSWMVFRKITWPLLRPTTVYVVITSVIGAFQVFESIYILFSSTEGIGGVLDSGLAVVPYLYENGFGLFRMGYASAIAWILFGIIFVLTLINLRVGRANEAY